MRPILPTLLQKFVQFGGRNAEAPGSPPTSLRQTMRL